MSGSLGRLYRWRVVLIGASILLIALGTLAGLLLPPGAAVTAVAGLLPLLGLAGMAIGGVTAWVGGRGHRGDGRRIALRSPVAGRWLAMNSPATKTPSHGVRAYGQAFALDLVHEPDAGARPTFGAGAAMRPPEDFPAFGQPVFAMCDGVVVSVTQWHRDHRSRSSVLAVIYMMVEAAVRELGGPGCIIGNHVTIRSEDGHYALVAHLRRGSVLVRVGDEVRAGAQIASCGNSGNSSEPHVHAQLMDSASPWTAAGIPIEFTGIRLSGTPDSGPTAGLPADGEHMLAAA
ncbi:M23 family metallopeptidase [Microterricola pindariensis]|uniref:Metalloendopeptidase n=1 Tax=Microterricola pindariensis TaxID=478010 RepID=A0ABX5AS35_9MICO|nr:M23 family metallopeptidase [Microterricola pindariensis]PPL14268.1 metalloendopeptidase [Microterricola pindariensis]